MTETCKGIAIITNHFKDTDNQPKIVYANKYFLNLLGVTLEKVVNQDPSNFFANWHTETFVKEIIACVDQKVSWTGDLDVYTHPENRTAEKKKFIITPVYDINGSISYYSCTTDVEKNCKCESVDNLIGLNDFIDSLWQYKSQYESDLTKKRDITQKLIALKGV
jgi:hypothetical protein